MIPLFVASDTVSSCSAGLGLLICSAHSSDALKAVLQISGSDASRNRAGAYFTQFFLIHQRAAGCHNIVFGFELDNGTFGSRSLFT